MGTSERLRLYFYPQSREILPQARKRLLHAIIGLELLYGIAVAAARLQQRARYREVGGERPPQLDLLADRRHFRPRVEHMRDAVPLQHLAVNAGQQLGIPQLDPVTKVPRQLLEKIIELVSPLQRIGQIFAAHRLELEHQAPGVIAQA